MSEADQYSIAVPEPILNDEKVIQEPSIQELRALRLKYLLNN
jgi:hypothetical protein